MCRELTKRFEEVVRGSAAELAARFAEPPKGEVTLVVGARRRRGRTCDGALAAVAELVAAGTPRRRRRGGRLAAERRPAQRPLPRHSVTTL